MPRVLAAFLDSRPNVKADLMMRASHVVEDLIASQQFDMGFAETPAPRASINQVDYELECVCILPADDPLRSAEVITPADLDGRPMAALFDHHGTALRTETVFREAGVRFNKRFELRTFLPGLTFVAAGACWMICDMITAYSHLLEAPEGARLAIRRFRPRISNSVSILTPGYATQSMAGRAFIRELETAVERMQVEVEKVLTDN